MLNRHEASYFLPAPFALSLCGVMFCVWNLLGGGTVPCPGNGCAVFSDFTIAGVSLWWVGACGFTLLGLCALAGKLALGKTLAACGMWCDVALLILMLVTTPCLPCLMVAVLLALTYLCFMQTASVRHRPVRGRFPFLLGLWGLLLIANLGALAHSLTAPWPMLEARDEVARAYVSPSCPACRQLIRETPSARMAGISWYPVAENEQDLRVIGSMLQSLQQGMSVPEAFAAGLEQPLAGPWALLRPDMLMLRLQLWRNQAHVLENGGVLPRLEFSGLPSFMVQPQPSAPRTPQPVSPVPSSGSSDPTLPGELSIIGRCTDANSSEPCQ